MPSKRFAVLMVCVVACVLGAPLRAGATAIAHSTLDFKNLAITPAAGTFSLDGPWSLEAFAHADNSLGEVANAFISSTSPHTISASATVTWATATGSASAPNAPPDLIVTGLAKSAVNIPGCPSAAAFSKGRGTLSNFFTLTSGAPSVGVTFQTDISGLLEVLTDSCGIFATTEVNFTLEVDGTPILSHHDRLTIGPNDFDPLPVAAHLSDTVTLATVDENKNPLSHRLLLEADSESGGEVPEPSAGLLLIAGLAALVAARRRNS